MRPLRLSIEGFACFRDKQELDFASLDLFAISGPTGAGKSSLLDAMIFALYGKVPRVGKEYGECISLGRDRLAVTFDFRIGPRSFRVTRIGRRRGAGSAQLEEILEGNDETKPLAEQVREVDRYVEALLGLGYEAFTQAVVLPQNEFAEFLKSKPADRRKILSSLLRLDVYERMKKRAGEIAANLRVSVQGYERRLAEDYGGATPEAIAVSTARLGEVRDANVERKKEIARTQRTLGHLTDLCKKTAELKQQQAILDGIRAREPGVLDAEKRLEAARRAAPIVPVLDAAVEAKTQAKAIETQARNHEGVVTKALKAVELCEGKLDVAKKAASVVPELNKRIRALDELKGAIRSRDVAEERLGKAVGASSSLEEERNACVKEVRDSTAELAAHEKLVVKLEKEAASVGFDPARAKKFDSWRDRAVELSQQRSTAAKASQKAMEAAQRAADEREKAEAASTLLGAIEEQLVAATTALQTVEDELRVSQTEHTASHLRSDLKPGDPCPVCLQTVSKVPQKGRAPKLEAIQARHASTKKKKEDLERKRNELDRDASKLVAAADKATEQAQQLHKGVDEETKAIERAGAKLEESLGALVSGRKGVPIEARVLEAVASEATLRERYEDAVAERDEAIRKRGALERAKEKHQTALERISEKLITNEARIKEQREEIARCAAEIRKVTKHPDPLAEREEVAQRCQELEDRVSGLKDELVALKRAQHEADTNAKALARQLEERAGISTQKNKEAAKALQEAGFDTEQAARSAVASASDQRRIEKEIDGHKRASHTAQERIDRLEEDLKGEYVSEAQVTEAETGFHQLQGAHEAGIGLEAALIGQITELKRKLDAASDLTKRLNDERLQCQHYEQLSSDLRSDRFQEFILREAFSELVARASDRLFKLSGRYTLDMKDGEFDVLDRDNAGERRSARTLSGGETFLASLALALELSEQVQRASGAVPLDSLFIDEGFGSLDPEALEVATDAIQSLPQGGRMVGIITHIAELTARLESRVIVEKRGEGSRLRVEAG